MSIVAFDHIANALMQVFGTPALLAAFLIITLLVMLVLARAHVLVILAIILPVIAYWALNKTSFIFMGRVTVILLLFLVGFFLAMWFISMFQR